MSCDFSFGHAMGVFLAAVGILVRYAMWMDDFEGIRSSYHYHRDLRNREPTSADAFFDCYYRDAGIPCEVVKQFLHLHSAFWNTKAELMCPKDDLFKVNAGVNAEEEWIQDVQQAFGISITLADCLRVNDGSFDSLLRLIHGKMALAHDASETVIDHEYNYRTL